MKHLFLDTNVLLDFLTDRKPFSEQAAILFQQSENKKVKLYVAAISFNNIYYIIRQVSSHPKAIELLRTLAGYTEIISVDSSVLKQAMASGFKDFEDAIQSFSAESVHEVQAIVTRNPKDFKNSNLPVFSPEAAISLLEL